MKSPVAYESEWVARHLESLGHEVIVADPNFAPMYASRNRNVKTDKRDARALCDACHLGAFRLSHRSSDESRLLRKHLELLFDWGRRFTEALQTGG